MAEPTARITGSGNYSGAEPPAPRKKKGLAKQAARNQVTEEPTETAADLDESETHELDTMA
jgi:hypothetical protein